MQSVPLPRQWFVVARADELPRERPIARTLQGVPLAVFRAGDRVAAFVDRCPHRNAPLSLGRVRESTLECAYHGWRFDADARCVAIPGSCEAETDAKARHPIAHAARELDGWIWVWSTPDDVPAREPFRFPAIGDARYTTVRREVTVQSTVHAAAENALDVPHTAFLHGGLFRTSRKEHVIDVVVRRGADRVEAEYLGEPRPPGLAARILAPRGGTVTHFDRFLLPSIAQVEYKLGDDTHLLITSALTPVEEAVTTMFAAVTFRTPLPGWIVKRVLDPVAMRIFGQDAAILARQTETIRRFGGEQYASSEIDVLGQQIWRLLKHASTGEPLEIEREYRLRMRV